MTSIQVQPVIVSPKLETAEPLDAGFDCSLTPTTRGATQWARNIPPKGKASFVDLDPHGFYHVRVFPTRFRPVGRLVSATSGKQEVRFACPIDPEKVTGFTFDGAPDDLRISGWANLGNFERAGLANIVAKAKATPIDDRRVGSVFDLLGRVVEVKEDRVFFEVSTDAERVVRETAEAGGFSKVPGGLHERDGYELGDSFKTNDTVGNLQVTFLRPLADRVDLPPLVDVDIDEHRRVLAHLFDVIRHHLTDTPTSAVDIHQILTAQGIPPGYSLIV